MGHFREEQLVERIDRELRQLPPLKAPATLAPRVLAAIEARARQPWWKRSWAHWPFSFRVVFFLLLLTVASSVIYAGFNLAPKIAPDLITDRLENYFGFLSPVWQLLTAVGIAFMSIVHSSGQLFLWSAVALAAVMYLTCVGLGTLCYRVALNKI